jgi:hypothetical protein
MDPIKQHIQDLEKDSEPGLARDCLDWHLVAMGAFTGAILGILKTTSPATATQSGLEQVAAETARRAFFGWLDANNLEIRKKGE